MTDTLNWVTTFNLTSNLRIKQVYVLTSSHKEGEIQKFHNDLEALKMEKIQQRVVTYKLCEK